MNYLSLAKIGGLCFRPGQKLSYNKRKKYTEINLTIYNRNNRKIRNKREIRKRKLHQK